MVSSLENPAVCTPTSPLSPTIADVFVQKTLFFLRQQYQPVSPLIQEAIYERPELTIARFIFSFGNTFKPNISDHERLIPFAAANYLMNCAMRILDDLADQDQAQSIAQRYGNAHALFSGGSIWFAAQQLIFDFVARQNQNSVPPLELPVYINQVYEKLMLAHLAESEAGSQIGSEQAYLERAALKSGLFFQMVCRFTAHLLQAPAAQVERYTIAGYHLGTLIQVCNDLESCFEPVPRNGLYRRSLSLPVIYASQVSPTFRQAWYDDTDTSYQTLTSNLKAGGALVYSRLTVQWLLQQIKEAIQIPDDFLLKYAHQLVARTLPKLN
jgi:geranylgeranyl pyrophosphate synthase